MAKQWMNNNIIRRQLQNILNPIIRRKPEETKTVSHFSSIFFRPSSSLSIPFNREVFLLPCKWSINSVNQKTSGFCTKTTDYERENNLESIKITSVTVKEAHQLHQAGHTYLDVRTPQEFNGGHAIGAINIPYMHALGSEMRKNPKFLDEVSSHFTKCNKIIVGCRSGRRSLMAASDLFAAGYSAIDIGGGYEAWTQNGLPTKN